MVNDDEGDAEARLRLDDPLLDDPLLDEPLLEDAQDEEEDSDSESDDGASRPFVVVDPKRLRSGAYVLAVFSLFSFMQGLNWVTYSASDHAKVAAYYSPEVINPRSVTLLLNWGPIWGCAMFPVQVWLLSRPGGFRKTLRLGALLCFLGALVRMGPTVAGPGLRRSAWAAPLLHAGQSLNAAAGPFCMGATARLSSIWFAEHRRTLTTALAVTANALGTNVGFVLGPWVVRRADDFGTLLWLELAIAAVPLACAVAWVPRNALDDAKPPAGTPTPSALATLRDGGRAMLANRGFGVVVLCAGAMGGVASAWQSLFQLTLRGEYSEATIGWLGFLNGLASNVGGLAMGFASVRHRLRSEIVAGLCVELALVLAFAQMQGYLGPRLLPESLPFALASVLGVGFSYGVCSPLFYELSAKLIAPMNEGTSVGVLVFLLNFFAFVSLAASSFLAPGAVTLAYLTTTAVAALAMAFSF